MGSCWGAEGPIVIWQRFLNILSRSTSPSVRLPLQSFFFLYLSLGLHLRWPRAHFTVLFAQHWLMNISGVVLLNGDHVVSTILLDLEFKEIDFIMSTLLICSDSYQVILNIVKDIDLFKAIKCLCSVAFYLAVEAGYCWVCIYGITFAHSLFCPNVGKGWHHHHLAVLSWRTHWFD